MGAAANKIKNTDNMMQLVEFIFNKFGASDELKERVKDLRIRIKNIPSLAAKNVKKTMHELAFIVQESEDLKNEIKPDIWLKIQIKSQEIKSELEEGYTNDDILAEMYKLTITQLLDIKKK